MSNYVTICRAGDVPVEITCLHSALAQAVQWCVATSNWYRDIIYFDTVDWCILLHRLSSWFGLSGKALSWHSSYLVTRSFVMNINFSVSNQFPLHQGVPQGCVLGPRSSLHSLHHPSALFSDSTCGHHLYTGPSLWTVLCSLENRTFHSTVLKLCWRRFLCSVSVIAALCD